MVAHDALEWRLKRPDECALCGAPQSQETDACADVRVYVGGRDQTKLAKEMPKQCHAVRAALAEVPVFAGTSMKAAVCFTNSALALPHA